MKITGIVAEYNPFHTGHGYQIAQTRARFDEKIGVVAVMSGNWVQQADSAVADKWTRARLALLGGADLVLELPTVWATASAERFARGAVSLLHHTGVVDHLSFGSEDGEIEPLKKAADALDSPEFQAGLSRHLEQGMSFPAARQRAVEQLLGEGASPLSSPNNNLGIEYLRSLNALGSTITPLTILRKGAAHNAISTDAPEFVSATHIRTCLKAERREDIFPYLVQGDQSPLFQENMQFSSLKLAERAILARIRAMRAEDWARLPDSSQAEGLPQRLEKAGGQCTSVEHFLTLVKTKRYTHARLRRLVLWAYLGLTADLIPETPSYLRVLGFNRTGQEILKAMKQSASLPLITKPAHARELPQPGRALFELESTMNACCISLTNGIWKIPFAARMILRVRPSKLW